MRVKEIQLDNFKSFGEKTTIPLLPGFTAISGPNGSGKSNVIDSLMFALGLTSTRNMRAERLTDLLNNLTGRKECSVRVVFFDDKTENEILVERKIRVKKNGYESKYFLDEEPSTLTQIHDRLSHYNISPRGYNVVMQGDVASIISMNSTDRRKIVDEIAGVADFDRKIELADKELEVVLERIESQEVILIELESRLKQLQKERDQAIKYAELKNRRTELERKFLAVRIKQLQNQKDKTEKEIENLKELKVKLQVESNTINEDMAASQASLNKLSEEIEELGEGRQRELGSKREEQKEIIAREESALGFIEKQITDHTQEQDKWKKEIKKIKQSLKDTDFKAQEYAQELESIQTNITEEETKYNALQDKIKSKSGSSNLSTQNIIENQEKVNELKENKAELEQEQARLEEKKNLLQAELDKRREEAEKILNELQNFRSKSGAFLQIDAIKEQIAFQVRNINTAKEEQRETRNEINNQQAKLRKVEMDLNRLEGQEQAANAAGFGRAVETVLGIDGVHGTLAQLGTVEGEYQTAVETCAGARLRAVVTEDDYVAQDCIEHLRDRKAGRATFLPLNKIKQARSYPLPPDRGVIDWAINLVSFDDEYRNAFSYAFADTLVVQNIEVARKMIGRYRMVTVQGDLVERSGAMSGGAAVKSNIHFGADTDREKQRLQSQRKETISFIEQLQTELAELEKQIDESRSKAEELKDKASKLEAESGVSSTQIQNLEAQYEKEKDSLKACSTELTTIDTKCENIANKISMQDSKIKTASDELQKVASEMKDSGLESLIEESREIEIELKRYQTMMNNLITESKSLEVEKNFNTQNLDKIQEELTASQNEVTSLQEKLPERQAKITEMLAEVEKINAEIAKIKEALQTKQAKRDSLSANLLELNQRKGSVTSQIESTAIKIVETRKRLASTVEHLNQLLEELKEHPDLEEVEISEEDLTKLQTELTKIEKQMRAMEPINMRAVEEYEEVSERQKEITDKQKSLTDEREMLIERIGGYKDDKKTTFMKHFTQVNEYFQETFADLSFGNGQLILEDPEEVFNGGLVIKAQPRGKKMQRLEAMSGGEKSLTALSFLFALQQCNPAPFYAFDEVDSALDGVNVDRLAHKIRRNTSDANNTQFVVVSHRRPMLEQSDRAVGVSVSKKGFSQVIGVQNIERPEAEEEEEVAAVA